MVSWVAIFLFLIALTFASTSYVIDLKCKISLILNKIFFFSKICTILQNYSTLIPQKFVAHGYKSHND